MGDLIKPVATEPIWPWMQEPFGDWLFGGFHKDPETGHYSFSGVDAYQGQLSPDIGQTRLPEVWNSWQPMDAGTMNLGDYVVNNGGGIGRNSPITNQLMQWGGTGGVGNNAMSLMMQYGTPSQAGQFVNNMAQQGMSSQGAGGNLAALAAGQPVGAAQYLLPFLTGQQGRNSYQAPMIQPRQLQRRP